MKYTFKVWEMVPCTESVTGFKRAQVVDSGEFELIDPYKPVYPRVQVYRWMREKFGGPSITISLQRRDLVSPDPLMRHSTPASFYSYEIFDTNLAAVWPERKFVPKFYVELRLFSILMDKAGKSES